MYIYINIYQNSLDKRLSEEISKKCDVSQIKSKVDETVFNKCVAALVKDVNNKAWRSNVEVRYIICVGGRCTGEFMHTHVLYIYMYIYSKYVYGTIYIYTYNIYFFMVY